VSVAAELQNDWRNLTGEELAALFSDHLIFYGHLISNLTASAQV